MNRLPQIISCNSTLETVQSVYRKKLPNGCFEILLTLVGKPNRIAFQAEEAISFLRKGALITVHSHCEFICIEKGDKLSKNGEVKTFTFYKRYSH